MRTHWFLRGLKFGLFVALMIVVKSFVLMRLWNWLLPGLFGWHLITFWQALGLLILCRILFRGCRGGAIHRWRWRRGMMERWHQMTPEQRETFRQGMRCGSFGSSAMEPKP